jgi:hypothetical protein
MTLVAKYNLDLTVRELLSDPSATEASIVHNAFNASGELTASSTPPATAVAAFTTTLVAGVATLDLTALPNGRGGTVNAAGLKIRLCKFINPAGNANPLVIQQGATNPYPYLGTTFSLTLPPGRQSEFADLVDPATLPAIGPTAKTIALSDGGAGGTDTHQVIIVLG